MATFSSSWSFLKSTLNDLKLNTTKTASSWIFFSPNSIFQVAWGEIRNQEMPLDKAGQLEKVGWWRCGDEEEVWKLHQRQGRVLQENIIADVKVVSFASGILL